MPVLCYPDELLVLPPRPVPDVVHPLLSLSSSFSGSWYSTLKNGLRHGLVACDMAEPHHFPPFDGDEQFFLLAYFLFDGSPHKLIGFLFLP